jgi:hypothetical protein
MLTERVASDKDKAQIGLEQIKRLLKDETLPFAQKLTVVVEDSSYSKPACLYTQSQLPNLVTIVRSRGTRTYYHQPVACVEPAQKSSPGRPTWHGQRFALSDPQTWSKADDCLTLWETSRRGKQHRIEIQVWHNMLTPGKRQPQPLPEALGRAGERTRPDEIQLLEPACRLLTLLGPGSMGKTRLAIEVAATLEDEFATGVWFVNLQPLNVPA